MGIPIADRRLPRDGNVAAPHSRRRQVAAILFVLCLLPLVCGHAADFDEVTHHGIIFIQIPAGSFTMGTGDKDKESLVEQKLWTKLQECERPARTVTITRPFLLGKYEVTQKQWKDVMGGKNPSAFKGDTLPVDSVAWEDAQAFLRELNKKGGKFRLPTEAEWEYAARAGSGGIYGLGRDKTPITAANLGEFAWFRENAENKTHPAGTRKPNAWGLHDMHGNVWEWCQDWHEPDFYLKAPAADPVNKTTNATERVFRGGSWFLDAYNQRVAFRAGNLPSFKSQYVGFRLVRDP